MPDFHVNAARWASRNRTAAIIVAAALTLVLISTVVVATSGRDNLIGLAVITVGFGLSALPGIVASARGTVHQGAIWVVAILLGWTVIGWIAALVWAVADSTPEQKRAEEARRAHMHAHAMAQMMRQRPPGYPPPRR